MNYEQRKNRGFSLIEMVVVISIFALFAMMVHVQMLGLFRRNTFTSQVNELVSAMRMAVRAAAESERRYEIIIDLTDQYFLFREITSPDLSEVLAEEIIVEKDFGDNCRVIEVVFDDGEFTNEGRAKFRAGRSGWQYGGKIILIDSREQFYSVVVNRLDGQVMLRRGDVAMLTPRSEDEVPF